MRTISHLLGLALLLALPGNAPRGQAGPEGGPFSSIASSAGEVCNAGMAGSFACSQIDLLTHVTLGQFSSAPTAANDIWGFVDRNDNREYALIGLANGTAVVHMTDPLNPVEAGTIPGIQTSWRDIKVYQFFNNVQGRWNAYAYVTADGVPEGLQIIDLTNLPASVSLAATYNGFTSAHNIFISNIDYSTGEALPGFTAFAYILGADVGGGAFRILDLTDPVNLVEVTPPPAGAGSSHDAVTLIISGPRTSACASGHDPCELLLDFNKDNLDIWDITDKAAPFHVSSTTYENLGFVHSGWPTDDTLFVTIHDELDEQNFNLNTTVRTLDISDLSTPVVSNVWSGPTGAIDHNGFFVGGLYYMSNYLRGLTLLDFSDPNQPRESAYFDTSPGNDGVGFGGAWGVYPYLPSGTILVSDVQQGLFLLRAVTNAAPSAVSLSPAATSAGSGDLTLTVQGAGFEPNSAGLWNGAGRPTTVVSSTELQIAIAASDVAAGGAAEVAVITPAPGGGITNPLTFTISSFSASASPGSVTVSAGQPATYTVTITPEFGSFDPTVSFACSGLPRLTSCAFSPAQVNPGANPASTTLTISTTTTSTVWPAPPIGGPAGLPLLILALGAMMLLFFTPWNMAGKRPFSRLRRWPALATLLALVALLVACGGSSPVAPPPVPGTPIGTHTITVTATAGTFSQTATVTLVVQ